MAHDIFISYSHKDKAVADAICAHMEGNGLRCWYAPRDIAPGASWAGSIIDAINATKLLVLVFTKDSNLSQQVLREISNAVSAGIPVVPFKLTEDEPVADMKYYLSTVHWLDAVDSDLEASIGDLYGLCRLLVDSINARASGESGDIPSDEDIARNFAALRADRQKAADETRAELDAKAAAGKKKTTAIIAAVAAVLLIAVLAIVIPRAGSKNQDGGSDPAVADGGSEESSGGSGWSGASESISMDITETYTQGNSQGCLANGGSIATDGERFYYRSNDGQAMFSMKPDGSEVTQLTYEPSSYISVYDGYIYYYSNSTDPCIKRMKPDGTEMTILHYGPIEDLRIVNDRIYYLDGMDSLHMFSMDLDGKNVKAENTLEQLYYFCLDGSYLYYADQSDGAKLYRSNMDGSDAECLLDHKIEHMTIAGNKLYFNDLNTNKFSSFDLTTGEVTPIYDDYICYINVTENGIYGYSGTQNTYLCYVQPDGLGFRVLIEDPVRDVCVCGDRIVYKHSDDNMLYMVDLEGQNKTAL